MFRSTSNDHVSEVRDYAGWQGLPAAIMFLLSLGVAVWHVFTPEGIHRARYYKQGLNAAEVGDFPTAQLCFERLVADAPKVDGFRLDLAKTLEKSGFSQRANRLMRELAPFDRVGYPPAHLFMAKTIMKENPLLPERAQIAQLHLARVLTADPESLEANEGMASLLNSMGAVAEARPYLESAAKYHPRWRVPLATSLFAEGKADLARKEFATAFQQLNRIINENPNDDNARLGLADAYVINGQFDQASSVLEFRLTDQTNFELATKLAVVYQQWQRYAQVRKDEELAKSIRARSDKFLERFVQFDDSKLLIALAGLRVVENRPAEVENLLQRLVKMQPVERTRLAHYYFAIGKTKEGTETAQQARDYLIQRLSQSPNDDFIRGTLAEIHLLLKEFEQCTNVLKQGLSQTDRQQYRTAIALAYGRWHDHLVREKKDDSTALQRLSEGLRYDPWNVDLFTRILRHADKADPLSEPSRLMMQEMLANGKVPGAIHAVLGAFEVIQGNQKKALSHFEIAFQQNSKIPDVANNLAWMLMELDPGSLPRALELSELAIKMQDSPQTRDTRGHILFRLGRYKEAVNDLERSIDRPQPNALTHETLAKAYEKLGLPDMAKKHLDRSKQLRDFSLPTTVDPANEAKPASGANKPADTKSDPGQNP